MLRRRKSATTDGRKTHPILVRSYARLPCEFRFDRGTPMATVAHQLAVVTGEVSVIHGFGDKLLAMAASIAPDSTSAEMHRKMAQPGTAKQ